ncbi:MAG TPA: substrate-binding domain-containing protein [bacterium]|nr:substrate-binding domain-containing protein [bacterium]
MNKWLRMLLSFLVLLGLFSCGGQHRQSGKLTLAVIPKGTTLLFWQSVHAGAIKAAREMDVNINWIGPEREDARQQQIGIVDNQTINQVDGIVLAPLDAMALRRPVEAAVGSGIPVVIIDSQLANSEEIITSFVATNNREGGRIAGRHLGKMLDGKGRVAVLRYSEGSSSTTNREEGFLEAIGEFDGIEVVSDEQYAGATKAQAQQASENLLIRFQDEAGHLTVDGIFCPNEGTTYGMLMALRRQRLTGEVTFVGFDASDALVEGLRRNDIDGLVVQNPFRMGYLGVQTLVRHLRGDEVPRRIDTGVTFITRDNLEQPEIQQLIKPDIEKWLSQG